MQSKVSLKSTCLFVVVAVVLSLVFDIKLNQNFYAKNDSTNLSAKSKNANQDKQKVSYYSNIIKNTLENNCFRRVLFTGANSQLVVMSIPAGGEVGEEIHKYTEQTLFFLSGTGEALLDDKKFPIGAGDVVVVTPGTKHNFWNTGKEDLKIYTTYSPPNHIDGRVHITKADADADTADEAVGEIPPSK